MVDKNDKTTEALRRLIAASGAPSWASTLNNIVIPAYMSLLGASLNIETATAKQLRDCFKDGTGIDGETLSKACRFYSQASGRCGDKAFLSSPGLAKEPPSKRPAGAKKAESKATERRPTSPNDGIAARKDVSVAEGMMEIPIYLPGGKCGTISIPHGITEADCDMVDAILRAYAKRQAAVRPK